MTDHTVTYVLKNDLGGISSLIKNLIDFRGSDSLSQQVILLRIDRNMLTSFEGHYVDGVPVLYFNHSRKDNQYYSFKKLNEKIGCGEGVIVSNDMYDLMMLTHYNNPKKVIQIVHDAYNVKLSIQFEAVIDKFICHSFFYYEVLCQLLPGRRDDIKFIYYGIPLMVTENERNFNNELQLVFIGRHDKQKGIFDLFEINKHLQENGTNVSWLVLGKGPETEAVKQQWTNETNIIFYTAQSSGEIVDLCLKKHVMVFPTKFEGFPVAMVEAMSVGCVPVVSNLPGGIRELGANNNAIICEPGNNKDFAAAITKLDKNRDLLEKMSFNCARYIREYHNAAIQSPKFQDFFKQIAFSPEKPRHHLVKKKLGSRLDHPMVPNLFTNLIRGKP